MLSVSDKNNRGNNTFLQTCLLGTTSSVWLNSQFHNSNVTGGLISIKSTTKSEGDTETGVIIFHFSPPLGSHTNSITSAYAHFRFDQDLADFKHTMNSKEHLCLQEINPNLLLLSQMYKRTLTNFSKAQNTLSTSLDKIQPTYQKFFQGAVTKSSMPCTWPITDFPLKLSTEIHSKYLRHLNFEFQTDPCATHIQPKFPCLNTQNIFCSLPIFYTQNISAFQHLVYFSFCQCHALPALPAPCRCCCLHSCPSGAMRLSLAHTSKAALPTPRHLRLSCTLTHSQYSPHIDPTPHAKANVQVLDMPMPASAYFKDWGLTDTPQTKRAQIDKIQEKKIPNLSLLFPCPKPNPLSVITTENSRGFHVY